VNERVVQLADVRARRPGWSQRDLAQLYRVASTLRTAGLFLETGSGMTDEHDPWFVFCDAESGEVVACFARISGEFIACSPFRGVSLSGRVFADLLGRFLDRWSDGGIVSLTTRPHGPHHDRRPRRSGRALHAEVVHFRSRLAH
jgi:hypothetical protein